MVRNWQKSRKTIRVDEVEESIAEAEERVQGVEDALLEPLKIQTCLEIKLKGQEGRSRTDNIRIHGVWEVIDNLDLSPTSDLQIERAHWAFSPRPKKDASPRSFEMLKWRKTDNQT